jgi:hypothetical protein
MKRGFFCDCPAASFAIAAVLVAGCFVVGLILGGVWP